MSETVGTEPATDVWGADRVYPDDSFIFKCHLAGYADFGSRVEKEALVLDLACGEGYGSAIIADRGAKCIGLDLAPELLVESARNYQSVSFIAGDARRLPFADNAFDAVAALQAIEHLTETDLFLGEIARVLKPSGMAYLTTPNIDRQPPTATKEFNPHHLRDFTPRDLREELTKWFNDVALFGQVQDPALPRTQLVVETAEREWAIVGKVARVERIARPFPGRVRVRLRRMLLRVAGIRAWPLPEAEAARREVKVEDFILAEPAEVSGCTVAIAGSPRK